MIPLYKNNKHYYNLYVPEKGSIRIIIESCSKVRIFDSKFIPNGDLEENIDFEK